MKERVPGKELIQRGDLFFLHHPDSEDVFSGYGLAVKDGSSEYLVGLLMIDRPGQAVEVWLDDVTETFGHYELAAMTEGGGRGIFCQMQIEPASQPFLRRLPLAQAAELQKTIEPLLEQPPQVALLMNWDEPSRAWLSQFASPDELPWYLKEVFENTGYGCLAAETHIGVIHICHAADVDIDGFVNKPVTYRWQLVPMPTAPLIRLEMVVVDYPERPYTFESFLNVADPDQTRVLARLANQEQLYLAFYGDDLKYRFAKTVAHGEQQWQQLDGIALAAEQYWESLPQESRDFDQAKAEFISNY